MDSTILGSCRARHRTAELARELREPLGRFFRRLRAEPGPPVAQLAVLSRLDRDGAASVSDLAAAERMRPQSMAQTVRDLEEAGLVARRPDPDDGRRVFVELTRPASRRSARPRPPRRLAHGTLEQVLDADERARLRAALELLDRVADA